MSDIVERLRERADMARKEATATALGDALAFEGAATEIETLRAQLAQAVEERDNAATLLRKFTAHYERWMDDHPDNGKSWSFPYHTFGDIRAARAFTERQP